MLIFFWGLMWVCGLMETLTMAAATRVKLSAMNVSPAAKTFSVSSSRYGASDGWWWWMMICWWHTTNKKCTCIHNITPTTWTTCLINLQFISFSLLWPPPNIACGNYRHLSDETCFSFLFMNFYVCVCVCVWFCCKVVVSVSFIPHTQTDTHNTDTDRQTD